MGRVIGRLSRYWKGRGPAATLLFVISRIFRREVNIVYEATLEKPLSPTRWDANEKLLLFGPENIDSSLNPRLVAFLGGGEAFESLEGVRNGDRLFVVANGNEYLHRGYVIFKSRRMKMIGEAEGTPFIGYCYTAPIARGRRLYPRTLHAQKCYLQTLGYQRVVVESAPENLASRKGIEAAGFTFAGEVSAWIVLNRFVLRRIQNAYGMNWRAVWI
jgi:hypothetical protein